MNTQENQIARLEKEIEFYKSQYFFLALISHDLRTKFSPIIGFSRLLLNKTSLTDEQKEYVNLLLNSGAYPLLEQINKFTNFSKLAAQKINLEEDVIHFHFIFDKLLESHLPKAKEKGLDLQVSSGTISNLVFTSDKLRLEQILDELVGNAIRFTLTGKVMINAELSETEAGRFINFEVTDTGVGFLPEKLERLVEFFEISKSPVDPFVVSLGLMNVKLLCELMNGKIAIKSQAGGGSTFRFSLPFKGV